MESSRRAGKLKDEDLPSCSLGRLSSTSTSVLSLIFYCLKALKTRAPQQNHSLTQPPTNRQSNIYKKWSIFHQKSILVTSHLVRSQHSSSGGLTHHVFGGFGGTIPPRAVPWVLLSPATASTDPWCPWEEGQGVWNGIWMPENVGISQIRHPRWHEKGRAGSWRCCPSSTHTNHKSLPLPPSPSHKSLSPPSQQQERPFLPCPKH